MIDKYILDIFITNKLYIHCMPGYFYDLNYEDIIIKNNAGELKFKITNNNVFNILYFIEIETTDEQELTIIIKKIDYINTLNVKKIAYDNVFLQAVIVMKDEYKYIDKYIDFYEKFHGVNRFIIFDNNSDLIDKKNIFKNTLCNRSNVIYQEYNVDYIFKHNNNSIDPDFFITAQNSAYSIALKKYNATWSMFFDLDEYIKPTVNLSNYLKSLDDNISAVNINGYWCGCNNMENENFDYKNITTRSNIICNSKNILKNDKNDYTLMIHHTQHKNTTLFTNINDIYFYHCLQLSIKQRQCKCTEHCCINDPIMIKNKLALVIRGHIRNSFLNDKLRDLIKSLAKLYDVDIYIYTWNKINTNDSWRTQQNCENIVIPDEILNYFGELKNNIVKIKIVDSEKINLNGTLNGNVCVTKCSIKAFKSMLYLQYNALDYIVKKNTDYNIVVNLRFDLYDVPPILTEDIYVSRVAKYIEYDFKNVKLLLTNEDITMDDKNLNIGINNGLENFMISNLFILHEFLKHMYLNFDTYHEKYKHVYHQEHMFYFENNSIKYSCQ